MADHYFHHVTEIVAEYGTQGNTHWVELTVTEEPWSDRIKTRTTLFVDDADFGKRLADAINAAQVKVGEAA